MPENRRMETMFLWGLAAALGALALIHWAVYSVEAPSWRTSWPAIPLTLAAIAAGLGGWASRRRAHRVRLMRR